MFTLSQIKEAHQSIVKTGADFPKYVQAIVQLGVSSYETFVSDGHTVYYGKDGSIQQNDAKYAALKISASADKENFRSLLKLHQQGKRDFMTFCNDCAETGVEKWIVNTAGMTCTYFDKAGNEVLIELTISEPKILVDCPGFGISSDS